jgi:hypothetical protein
MITKDDIVPGARLYLETDEIKTIISVSEITDDGKVNGGVITNYKTGRYAGAHRMSMLGAENTVEECAEIWKDFSKGD